MLFRPRYDMVKLPQVPRDKATLQMRIADTRLKRRKSRLMRFASCNLVAWSLFILLVWIPTHTPHASAPAAPFHQQPHQQRPSSPQSSSRAQ